MTGSIIHLAHDDKFIRAGRELFDQAYPGSNKYLLLTQPGQRLRHTADLTAAANVVRIECQNKEGIKSLLAEAKLVVVHWLDAAKCQIVLDNPQLSFLWMFWGGEIYDDPSFNESALYGTLTDKLIARITRRNFRGMIGSFLGKKNEDRNCRLKKKTIQQIQYIGITDPKEFDLFRDQNLFAEEARPVRFSYYTDTSFGTIAGQPQASDVLIGNSASYTNNHLDLLDRLDKMSIGSRRIVLPMGYSRNERYVRAIRRFGQAKFGHQFKTIDQYLNLDEFQEMIRNCEVAFFGHYRQQALGTILTCMHHGVRVFLEQRNSNFGFLKRLGFVISELSEIDTPLQQLSNEQKMHNRNLIRQYWSRKAIINNLRSDLANHFDKITESKQINI